MTKLRKQVDPWTLAKAACSGEPACALPSANLSFTALLQNITGTRMTRSVFVPILLEGTLQCSRASSTNY